MGALKDLLSSEKGLFAIVLVIAATVLVGLDQMAVADWREYTIYVFGAYVVGKTVTTGMVAIAGRPAAIPPAPAPAAAAPTVVAVSQGTSS